MHLLTLTFNSPLCKKSLFNMYYKFWGFLISHFKYQKVFGFIIDDTVSEWQICWLVDSRRYWTRLANLETACYFEGVLYTFFQIRPWNGHLCFRNYLLQNYHFAQVTKGPPGVFAINIHIQKKVAKEKKAATFIIGIRFNCKDTEILNTSYPHCLIFSVDLSFLGKHVNQLFLIL